ncbi:KilA-N domain-containing protein [Adhaeribacter rhizoryzae]|uniref:KilA-N domain-containing protein n=1 Tax=Adhaeribacter rhizoryzae TaxID=2607907 RepID=A0A5M6DPH9_9BACT|nr:KilA-N domain-containing protein [Adhaeribacter rhizoryzae]KAA5548090.1 KilA-N domain-containing protein [Adhaeribacter rhizoryzae]
MSKGKKAAIEVKGTSITVITHGKEDFISLSDMVKSFDGGAALIEQWLRNKNTVEFLGIWEQINNPDFNSPEFEGIKNEAGTNRFYLSAKKWIETTMAKGLIASAGRYGGTYAHRDIAFEFGSWLSPEFKLYLIKEFQRLKDDENSRLSLNWDLHRTLAKVNYRIHTDSIKENIIPPTITKEQARLIYANEADLLNVAIFGKTAAEWRQENPDLKGNIRDYSTIEQLLVLSNLESLNAEFIRMNLPPAERLKKLNEIAITQLKSLLPTPQIKKLPKQK